MPTCNDYEQKRNKRYWAEPANESEVVAAG
jgi:hypothetical protein